MTSPRSFSLTTLIGASLVASLTCGMLGFLGGVLTPVFRSPTPRAATISAPLYAYAVVALVDIRAGSPILDSMVTSVPYPADLVFETMVVDTDQVIGKFARVDIVRGMIITTGLLGRD